MLATGKCAQILTSIEENCCRVIVLVLKETCEKNELGFFVFFWQELGFVG